MKEKRVEELDSSVRANLGEGPCGQRSGRSRLRARDLPGAGPFFGP